MIGSVENRGRRVSGGARLAEVAAGGKPALARALAAIERSSLRPGGDPEIAALLDAALAAPRAHLIGLTGPPGVGKSTLTDALIRRLAGQGAKETVTETTTAAARGVAAGTAARAADGRHPRSGGRAGQTVGVIAVDPSSKRSGGALLGDRTRIARDPQDDRVFMRSMAARDRLGGLAELTFPAAVLMGALKDVVIVETVGVGQSETDIADVADTVVFCAQPGSGDALQF
ncbi:MAG: hypothetical protein AAF675_11315, partial [Pseudomonadota bacterium]